MKRRDHTKLDRLLSGGSDVLSVQEKEKMLVHLVGKTTSTAPNRAPKARRLGVWLAGGLAGATAAAMITLLVYTPTMEHHPDISSEFTARGGADQGAFRIECIQTGGEAAACQPGATLVFGLMPPENAAYFSAAALSDSGRLIRYFPSAEHSSVALDKPRILKEGIYIGEEHAPGAYRVFGVFSTSPLSPEEVKSAIEAFADDTTATVPDHIVVIREISMEVAAP